MASTVDLLGLTAGREVVPDVLESHFLKTIHQKGGECHKCQKKGSCTLFCGASVCLSNVIIVSNVLDPGYFYFACISEDGG